MRKNCASPCGILVRLVLLAFGATVPVAAQNVFVVDTSGGGDFTGLQDAVNAAVTGDVILVHSTSYGDVVIDGKGVAVVGLALNPHQIYFGGLIVRNLPTQAVVTLRLLSMESSSVFVPAVDLHDNAGAVFMESCLVMGVDSRGDLNPPPAGLAMLVNNCASVALVDSVIVGGDGHPQILPYILASTGGPGLRIIDSEVSVELTEVSGGKGGGSNTMYGGEPGGHAIELTGGFVHFAGATVTGGANGAGCTLCDGSDGLHVFAGAGQGVHSDFAAGSMDYGPPGQAIDAPPGAVINLLDQARIFLVDSPLWSLHEGTLTYFGEPQDLVSVFISGSSGFVPLPSMGGVWQLGPLAAGPLPLGVVDGTGKFVLTFRAPALPPGVEGMALVAQCLVQTEDGELRVSSPTTTAIVLEAF